MVNKCSPSIDWTCAWFVKLAWSCSKRFCVISFVEADFAPHNTFGVFSVRIRMQSYYTLEGLSHSHRMAMNFKCGIKAFREAFTWGRLTQFLANWIFIYLFKKKGFGNKIVNRKNPSFGFFSAVPSNKPTAGTSILSERNPSTAVNILFFCESK